MTRSLAVLFGLALVALIAQPVVAGDEITLEGTFVWVRDDGQDSGDLTAVMTPDGEDAWNVAFHFVWEEEPHVYTGTAKGSLTSGALEGTAISDNEERRMTFRFNGTVEDGKFSGTHGFVRDDGTVSEGGTLTLARRE